MNIANLQAMLRHFAAERDWQTFHTPKNLTTALMVEAAELAEVSQWMTPEESRNAHTDTASEERIREEIADVLLYLPQVADHTQIDVKQAVDDKLVRNALKFPAKRVIVAASVSRRHHPIRTSCWTTRMCSQPRSTCGRWCRKPTACGFSMGRIRNMSSNASRRLVRA